MSQQPTNSDSFLLRRWRRFWSLRREPTTAEAVAWGAVCLGACWLLWWFVTWAPPDEPEQRIVGYAQLPSPSETFEKFHQLWFDQALTRNAAASLRRVALGFGLATIVGLPVGVLCGCLASFRAFFAPIMLFGRYVPVAALIPLTFSLFGIGELQKVMFIFIACVAFIVSDTARAVADVGQQYVDTALTLGASRRQVVMKVLVPLAMPDVFNSLRLLFGLAFGYIMLAEVVKLGGESGGLGDIIITSQRRGLREPIYLVLLIIPLVAFAIDRVLFWVQKELFPHRYGGAGVLRLGARGASHLIEDATSIFLRRTRAPEGFLPEKPARQEPVS
ncbi:MAG TPA: ABC transporter permease [Pirellulales bacterium]|jgi:NitT/TauT family transport system permease protein|nr:ABC transporter permease [Pirellulales bacterium]